MPEKIPEITPEVKSKWSKLSFPELTKEILAQFVSEDEIPRQDIGLIVDKATERFLNGESKGMIYFQMNPFCSVSI